MTGALAIFILAQLVARTLVHCECDCQVCRDDESQDAEERFVGMGV